MSVELVTPSEATLRLGAVAPQRCLVLSGAGVSADAPSCGPLGDTLTRRALAAGFDPEFAGRLSSYYADLRLARALPRLETVLDVFQRVHGERAMLGLLGDMASMAANQNHAILADHLNAGGWQLTANFDTCIESLATGDGAARLTHFHGSLGAGVASCSLGATLTSIERGFPSAMEAELDAVWQASWEVLLVVGYSGRDFFDFDRWLSSRCSPGALAGRRIVWVEHASGPMPTASPVHRQFAWLSDAGAEIAVVYAETSVLLDDVAQVWGMRAAPVDATAPRAEPATPAVSAESRALATLDLATMMGLTREVDRLLVEHRFLLDARPDLIAATRWHQGRNREASWAWASTLVQGDPASRAAVDERIAACLWHRGSLVRAYLHSSRAMRRAQQSGTVAPETSVVLAETKGRILVDMRRSPDLRWFASRRRRVRAADDVAQAARAAEPMGVHLAARVESVCGLLLDRPNRDAEHRAASQTFDESEALHAMLNYRRGRVRARVTAGELVPASEFRRLRDDLATVGLDGGASSLPLVPGAEHAFSRAERFQAVGRVDVTLWQRVRLVLRVLGIRSSRLV